MNMSDIMLDYVKSVAGHPVTAEEAAEFVRGLEDFQKLTVSYDVVDQSGVLRTRKSRFATLKGAMDFVRSLGSKARTLPIIEDDAS
jgi:excinuclease UvrABC ATPase subunit